MDLQALRAEIDEIDDEILELFLRRMGIVENVARYKIANGLPVLHPAREAEILTRVSQKTGGTMGYHARQLFECMMALSRRMQEGLMAEADRSGD